jgi:flagellar motor switch protein FliN
MAHTHPEAEEKMDSHGPTATGVGTSEPPEIPQFEELNTGTVPEQPATLSVVYDLSLPVSIELGRTRMSVQEVLSLGRGSVIQLERLAGEPIDVLVGDRRFAEGEVVVVGEQFGVRITRVLALSQSNGDGH